MLVCAAAPPSWRTSELGPRIRVQQAVLSLHRSKLTC